MDYNITNMTTDEIKEAINNLYYEVDTETDIYYLFLMDELELRLPKKDFTDFCNMQKSEVTR